MIIEHTITREEQGKELLSILKNAMSLSATTVKRLKHNDGIKVDGKTAFTNYRVSNGERVTVIIREPSSDILPEEGEIDIIYEDEYMLAANKPCGQLVHPSRARNTGTLSNYVLGYLRLRSDTANCHTVNRLDRDTSGVVLFAKNAHIKNLAINSIRFKESRKEYAAVVYGKPKADKGIIDAPIKRLKERDMLRVVDAQGERAVTEYSLEGTYKCMSLVRFRLFTGRTHQIRVHCLYSGIPIIGDCLYHTAESKAASAAIGANSQYLHNYLMEFIHPVTGEGMRLIAPITRPDMAHAVRKIGKNSQKRTIFYTMLTFDKL